jgi:hypothetical protein
MPNCRKNFQHDAENTDEHPRYVIAVAPMIADNTHANSPIAISLKGAYVVERCAKIGLKTQ